MESENKDMSNPTPQQTPAVINDEVALQQVPDKSSFAVGSFEHAQRVAKMLSTSSMIPDHYKGNIQNTMIALEMANRIGASPLMIMQNLYIVQGKPSWSSSFIIASLNACKRFSPLRFEMGGEGEEYGCQAWAYDLATNDKLTGPKITLAMAKAEGWLAKAGSKWKTMPELMFRYRAAAFFGRLYAPDILMGMQTVEEVQDVHATVERNPELDDAINEMAEAKTEEAFAGIAAKYPGLSDDKEFNKSILYYKRKNLK